MEKPNLCLEVLKILALFLFMISHSYSHNSWQFEAGIFFYVIIKY